MNRILALLALGGLLLCAPTSGGEAKTITVYTNFDGVLVPCLVDSGATYTTVRATEAATMPTLGPTVGAASLMGAGGPLFVGQIRRIPLITIPYFVWPDVDIVVVADNNLALACLLGGDVLGRQDITISYSRGMVLPVSPTPGTKGGE